MFALDLTLLKIIYQVYLFIYATIINILKLIVEMLIIYEISQCFKLSILAFSQLFKCSVKNHLTCKW